MFPPKVPLSLLWRLSFLCRHIHDTLAFNNSLTPAFNWFTHVRPIDVNNIVISFVIANYSSMDALTRRVRIRRDLICWHRTLSSYERLVRYFITIWMQIGTNSATILNICGHPRVNLHIWSNATTRQKDFHRLYVCISFPWKKNSDDKKLALQ